MAIYRLLRNLTFGPGETANMTAAYEIALLDLRIEDRDDPRTEAIALAIIHRARAGEEDARALADFAIRQITKTSNDAREVPSLPDTVPKVPPQKKAD
jgi:hypothetical protein